MANMSFGIVDNWLRNIKDVYQKHVEELVLISDDEKRIDRLTELNVIEQVKNLAKTTIIQEAWKQRKGELHLHGWVYGINSGLITDLNVIHDETDDLDPIYRTEF
jgi:carbonic anhydrase